MRLSLILVISSTIISMAVSVRAVAMEEIVVYGRQSTAQNYDLYLGYLPARRSFIKIADRDIQDMDHYETYLDCVWDINNDNSVTKCQQTWAYSGGAMCSIVSQMGRNVTTRIMKKIDRDAEIGYGGPQTLTEYCATFAQQWSDNYCATDYKYNLINTCMGEGPWIPTSIR